MSRGLRSLLAVIAMSLPFSHAVQAEDAPAYVVSYVEVLPEQASAAREWLKTFAAESRKSDGNLRFEVLQRITAPHHFAVLESWKDAKAQQSHAASLDTKTLRGKIEGVQAAPYDERPHGALAAGPAGNVGAAAIYAVTHVDCVPTRKDDGIVLLKDLSGPSRQENGNLRFDVLQQASRPNHFTVIEAWKDEAGVLSHVAAPHTRQFRAALHPIGGALYDERFYKAID